MNDCRQRNNPYIPGNSLFGPTRQQLWGPDPCQQEEQELQQAQQQLAQISQAPTQQSPASGVAPILSDSFDTTDFLDPAIPAMENTVPSPQLVNMWSPTSLEDTMNLIWDQMEAENMEHSSVEEELQRIHQTLLNFFQWIPVPPIPVKARYQFLPKNKKWIGRWVPE